MGKEHVRTFEAQLQRINYTTPSPDVHNALRQLDRVMRFHLLPRPLEGSAVAADRGAGNCRSLAHRSVEDLLRDGIEARVREGYVWGYTKATEHTWIEVRDKDGWCAVDPLLYTLQNIGFEQAGRVMNSHVTGPNILAVEGDHRPVHNCIHRNSEVQMEIEVQLSRANDNV